jgi:hypothetical protein
MDQAEFSEFVRNSGLDSESIARAFNISIPTAKKWLTGRSMPSSPMIPVVVRTIKELQEQEISYEDT